MASPRREHHPVRGGYADGGGAPHDHVADGVSDLPAVGITPSQGLPRQEALVEEREGAVAPGDRVHRRWAVP